MPGIVRWRPTRPRLAGPGTAVPSWCASSSPDRASLDSNRPSASAGGRFAFPVGAWLPLRQDLLWSESMFTRCVQAILALSVIAIPLVAQQPDAIEVGLFGRVSHYSDAIS